MKKLVMVAMILVVGLTLASCSKEVTYTQDEVDKLLEEQNIANEIVVNDYEKQIEDLQFNVLEQKMVRYINTIQEFTLAKYEIYQGKATVTEFNICHEGCTTDLTRVEFDSEEELLAWWDDQVESFRELVK